MVYDHIFKKWKPKNRDTCLADRGSNPNLLMVNAGSFKMTHREILIKNKFESVDAAKPS